MHGEPALPADYTHLPYANPDAPQGGALHQAITGSFDSVNPFIVMGQKPYGAGTFVVESLLGRNWGEPFSVQAGGVNPSVRLIVALSNGLCGATHGASRALPTQISVSSAATMVTGERRKLHARSWSQARRQRPAGPCTRYLPALPGASIFAKRDSGASLARWIVLTFFFIAHGRSW